MATIDQARSALGASPEMGSADFIKAITNSITGPVGELKRYMKEKTDTQKQAEEQLRQMKYLTDGLKEATETVKKIQKITTSTKGGKTVRTESTALEENTYKLLSKMAKEAVTGHSLHTHDYTMAKQMELLIHSVNDMHYGIVEAIQSIRKRGGGTISKPLTRSVSGGMVGGIPEAAGIPEAGGIKEVGTEMKGVEAQTGKWVNRLDKAQNAIYNAEYALSRVKRAFDIITPSTYGMLPKFDPEESFKRGLKERFEFVHEFSQAIYSAMGRGDMKMVENVRESTLTLAEETMESTENISKIQMRILRQGITSQKKIIDLTNTGVRLGKQIGADTSQTSDELLSWVQRYRMTNMEAVVLSKQIQSIGRITGVTGDNLLTAVKNARQLADAMRSAGTFSSDANNSLIAITAASQKLGTEGIMQSLLHAMTSPTTAIESGFMPIFAQAGMMNEVMRGSMFDPASQKKLLDFFKQLEGRVKGMPLIAQQNYLQSVTGGKFAGLGDLQAAVKTMEESLPDVKLARLRMELEKGEINMTEKQIEAKKQEIEQIEKGISLANQTKQLGMLADISKILVTKGGTIGEAMGGQSQENIRKTLESLGKAAGISNLDTKIAEAMNNGKAFNVLSQDIQSALEKQTGEERKMTDPVTQAMDSINKSSLAIQTAGEKSAQYLMETLGPEMLANIERTAGTITAVLGTLEKIAYILGASSVLSNVASVLKGGGGSAIGAAGGVGRTLFPSLAGGAASYASGGTALTAAGTIALPVVAVAGAFLIKKAIDGNIEMADNASKNFQIIGEKIKDQHERERAQASSLYLLKKEQLEEEGKKVAEHQAKMAAAQKELNDSWSAMFFAGAKREAQRAIDQRNAQIKDRELALKQAVSDQETLSNLGRTIWRKGHVMDNDLDKNIQANSIQKAQSVYMSSVGQKMFGVDAKDTVLMEKAVSRYMELRRDRRDVNTGETSRALSPEKALADTELQKLFKSMGKKVDLAQLEKNFESYSILAGKRHGMGERLKSMGEGDEDFSTFMTAQLGKYSGKQYKNLEEAAFGASPEAILKAVTEYGNSRNLTMETNKNMAQELIDLQKKQEQSQKDLQGMATAAQTPGSIYTHDTHLEGALLQMSDSLQQIALVKPDIATAAASAKSSEEMMKRRIETEFAGTTPGATMEKANDSLDEISSTNERQTRLMEEEIAVLKGILAAMTMKSNNNPNTALDMLPSRPANYYDWAIRPLNSPGFGGVENLTRG